VRRVFCDICYSFFFLFLYSDHCFTCCYHWNSLRSVVVVGYSCLLQFVLLFVQNFTVRCCWACCSAYVCLLFSFTVLTDGVLCPHSVSAFRTLPTTCVPVVPLVLPALRIFCDLFCFVVWKRAVPLLPFVLYHSLNASRYRAICCSFYLRAFYRYCSGTFLPRVFRPFIERYPGRCGRSLKTAMRHSLKNFLGAFPIVSCNSLSYTLFRWVSLLPL